MARPTIVPVHGSTPVHAWQRAEIHLLLCSRVATTPFYFFYSRLGFRSESCGPHCHFALHLLGFFSSLRWPFSWYGRLWYKVPVSGMATHVCIVNAQGETQPSVLKEFVSIQLTSVRRSMVRSSTCQFMTTQCSGKRSLEARYSKYTSG